MHSRIKKVYLNIAWKLKGNVYLNLKFIFCLKFIFFIHDIFCCIDMKSQYLLPIKQIDRGKDHYFIVH